MTTETPPRPDIVTAQNMFWLGGSLPPYLGNRPDLHHGIFHRAYPPTMPAYPHLGDKHYKNQSQMEDYRREIVRKREESERITIETQFFGLDNHAQREFFSYATRIGKYIVVETTKEKEKKILDSKTWHDIWKGKPAWFMFCGECCSNFKYKQFKARQEFIRHCYYRHPQLYQLIILGMDH